MNYNETLYLYLWYVFGNIYLKNIEMVPGLTYIIINKSVPFVNTDFIYFFKNLKQKTNHVYV